MKPRVLFAGAVSVCLALALASYAAQNEPKRPAAPPAAPAKAAPATTKLAAPATPGSMSPDEERMMKAGLVGPQHKALEPLVGTWNAVCTFWMPGSESSQPDKSTGTQVSKWIFDGRWIQSDFTGEWAGQPFQGLGYLGYDNTQQKYISTWMDSMCTGMMHSTGTADPTGKVFTFTMPKQTCPMTGKPCTGRSVLKIENNDKHSFTMFTTYEGEKETKSGEIIYTRKK